VTESAMDRMHAATSPKPTACKVCSTLPPDILEALDAGLTEQMAVASLVRWLAEEGYPLSDTAVTAHRRKHL